MWKQISLIVNSATIFVICYSLYKFVDGYENIWLLPFSYFVCFNLCFKCLIRKYNSLTVKIVSITAFLRYVLLALLLVCKPSYRVSEFYCYDSELLTKSLLFMNYELIIISLFFTLYYAMNGRKMLLYQSVSYQKERVLYFNDNRGVLVSKAYIVISLLICLLFPSVFDYVNFFKLDVGTSTRVSGIELKAFDLFLRQLLQIAILLSFTLIALYNRKCFLKRGGNKYIYISLVAAFFCISLIIGEQRSVQVYTVFATIFFMRLLYPSYKKMITNILLIAATVILLLLSIYKTFYAFNYTSYGDALIDSNFAENLISYQGEIYLLGPQTVAAAMKVYDSFDLGIGTFLFDIFRSFMGLNFFVKDMSIESTSVVFNNFVSSNSMSNGYLLPISSQGLIYFGFIFGPLLICFFYWITLILEKKMYTCKVPFLVFFMSYVYIRYSTCLISTNINTIITMSSSILLFVGLIYLIQKMYINAVR